MDDYSLRESLVDTYVAQDDTKAAVGLLFELIIECARRKDFGRAEGFRARMMDVDPFALTEIIQSGEIIEEAKRQSIDGEHAALWSDLHAVLTPEEGSAVYLGLKTLTIDATDTLFHQGEQHSRLYFIRRGNLAVLWRTGDREDVLKRLGPGDVAAADGFFSESVCTVSLVALSRAELAYLEKETLIEWEKPFPALEGKLRDYVRASCDIPSLLRQRSVERRSQRRLKTPGSIMVQLLSGTGSPLGKPFRGDLADVSRGGAAFFAGIRDRKTSRALLGRPVVLTIPIPGNVPPLKFIRKGTIVAISHSPFEGSCLHVELEERLSEQETMDISSALRIDRR